MTTNQLTDFDLQYNSLHNCQESFVAVGKHTDLNNQQPCLLHCVCDSSTQEFLLSNKFFFVVQFLRLHFLLYTYRNESSLPMNH